MTRARWLRFAVLLAAGAVACVSPTTPAPPTLGPHFPAGMAISFRSGEDDRVVANALVTIQGQSVEGPFEQTYVTDADGRARLDRAILHDPIPLLAVEAPGFLHRRTFLRPTETPAFPLWPSASPTGLDADATRALVYGENNCPGGPGGFSSLHRLVPGTTEVTLVPDPALTADIRLRLAEAVNRMNTGLGEGLRYVVRDVRPQTGVYFDVRLGGVGCDGIAAYASLDFGQDGIISGRVVYCGTEFTTVRITLHELGHTYGLKHSLKPGDVMRCGSLEDMLSQRERTAMKLMLLRRVGNLWPDRDPGYTSDPPVPLSAQGTTSRTEIIKCPIGMH